MANASPKNEHGNFQGFSPFKVSKPFKPSRFQAPRTARAIHPYPLHHRGDSSVEPPRQDLSLEMPRGLVDTPTNRSHDHMDGEGTLSFHVICQVKKNRSFLPKDVATSLMGVLQCLWISVKILVQGSLERSKDPMNRDWLRLKGVLEINPNNELMDSLNE